MTRHALLLLSAAVLLAGCAARPAAEASSDPSSLDRPVDLHGMFSYLADAASFLDCATAERYPVAMEGDYLALEGAYLAARRYDAEPLLVEVRGTLSPRPGLEGDRVQTHLVVTEYVNIYPGETCGNSLASESLVDMYWKLTRLEGESVERIDGQREPHLVLHSEEQRLAGSGGCNRLTGSYQLHEDTLTFERVATSRMACPDGMEQEQRFLSALADVRFWRIEGSHLELLSRTREVLARFQATPMQ
jgi:copper homeostasis protein (lipoprotein)